jgi:hypothetical protein
MMERFRTWLLIRPYMGRTWLAFAIRAVLVVVILIVLLRVLVELL